MKKPVLSFFLLLGTIVYSSNASAEIKTFTKANAILTDTTISAAIPDAVSLLQEIISVTGLQQNFELKEAKVLNIEAAILHKKRYILYNPVFVNSLNNVAKSKWALTALLAHEVGHHLNGHTIKKNGSNRELELEADEFSGFILHKMGATLAQAKQVMLFVAKKDASSSHPGQVARMNAIEKGWNRAERN